MQYSLSLKIPNNTQILKRRQLWLKDTVSLCPLINYKQKWWPWDMQFMANILFSEKTYSIIKLIRIVIVLTKCWQIKETIEF